MKLKTIATVALIGTIYLTVISIMIDIGIFKDIQNIVKIGGFSEFGESHTVSIDSTIFITTVQRNYPIGSVDLNRNHSSDVLV